MLINNNKIIDSLLDFLFILIIILFFLVPILYINIYKEVSFAEYKDINILKNKAKKILKSTENLSKEKNYNFNIKTNNIYFIQPNKNNIMINKYELKFFLNLIKKSMKDNKIDEYEFHNILNYLNIIIKNRKTEKINSIKKNLIN